MISIIVIAIYASFVFDFAVIPIPSEASTRAILKRAENRYSIKYLLLHLTHLALLLLWLMPFAAASLVLYRYQFAIESSWFAWLGISIALLGRLITLLGSVTYRRAPAKQLIDHSVFSFSRHPIVLGLHLTLGGLLCTTGSLVALACFPATLIYFDRKIRIEERALIEQYGQDYHQYSSRTPRYLRLPTFKAGRQ